MRYDPDVDVGDPLRPDEVAALLAGSAARWWLSGGCGIDAWLARRTRQHGDIDVSVVRGDRSDHRRVVDQCWGSMYRSHTHVATDSAANTTAVTVSVSSELADA